MTYLKEVQRGMDLLASHPKSIFVGQAMEFKGHAISRQVNKYPKEKLLEFPVAENMQAGYCLGLAIEGFIPISCYPRCDFAILACDQIVNHIDKWEQLTGQTLPILTKILVGAKKPIDAGHQHTANHTEAFKCLCKYIEILELKTTESVFPAYQKFINEKKPLIIIEHTELYS